MFECVGTCKLLNTIGAGVIVESRAFDCVSIVSALPRLASNIGSCLAGAAYPVDYEKDKVWIRSKPPALIPTPLA